MPEQHYVPCEEPISLSQILTKCKKTSAGIHPSSNYFHTDLEAFDDEYLYVKQDNVSFIGVFSGLGGSRVARYCREYFAQAFLEMDFSQIDNDETVSAVLEEAFQLFDKSYFRTIDTTLARRVTLRDEIQLNYYGFSGTRELSDINKMISQGASALIIVVIGNKKYHVARVGTCRALLVSGISELRCDQLGADHDFNNGDEVLQLRNHLGDSYLSAVANSVKVTRFLGNFIVKRDTLSQDKSAILSKPEMYISPLRDADQFFLIASAGLIRSIEEIIRRRSPMLGPEDTRNAVNDYLRSKVIELQPERSFADLSQAVVDSIAEEHLRLFKPDLSAGNLTSLMRGSTTPREMDTLTLLIQEESLYGEVKEPADSDDDLEDEEGKGYGEGVGVCGEEEMTNQVEEEGACGGEGIPDVNGALA